MVLTDSQYIVEYQMSMYSCFGHTDAMNGTIEVNNLSIAPTVAFAVVEM